jgi:hypothetical protein
MGNFIAEMTRLQVWAVFSDKSMSVREKKRSYVSWRLTAGASLTRAEAGL